MRPEAPGYCTSTPLRSPSGSPSARSATTTSMPIAPARVRITSIVWGRASASTTNGPFGRLVGPSYERHRLGGSRALVEQRGVGGLEPGEVGDHRLEVQQRLEPALADLGLVGRVGGVPGRVLEHVAAYDGRRHRAVVAESDHRDQRVVHRSDLAELGRGGALRGRGRQVEARRSGSGWALRRPSVRRGCSAPSRLSISVTWWSSGPMCRSLNGRAFEGRGEGLPGCRV